MNDIFVVFYPIFFRGEIFVTLKPVFIKILRKMVFSLAERLAWKHLTAKWMTHAKTQPAAQPRDISR